MSSGPDIRVRKARLEDIDAIKELADAHKLELGFVRRPALMEAIRRGEIFIAEKAHQIIGFVNYHHRKDGKTTLYHIVVSPEFRRIGVGKALLRSLCFEAEALGQISIRLKCPTDLPANRFYKKIGCVWRGLEKGPKRLLNIWELNPTNQLMLD